MCSGPPMAAASTSSAVAAKAAPRKCGRPMRRQQREQITDLPLDVETYRVAPNGSGHRGGPCRVPGLQAANEIACTVERRKAEGREEHRPTPRPHSSCATGIPGRTARATTSSTCRSKEANAQPVALTDGFDGDCPSKPFGGNEDFVPSATMAAPCTSAPGWPGGPSRGAPTSTSSACR
jgi:hypothetical protein